MNRTIALTARRHRTAIGALLVATALTGLGVATTAPAAATAGTSDTVQQVWPIVPDPRLPVPCRHFPLERPICLL